MMSSEFDDQGLLRQDHYGGIVRLSGETWTLVVVGENSCCLPWCRACPGVMPTCGQHPVMVAISGVLDTEPVQVLLIVLYRHILTCIITQYGSDFFSVWLLNIFPMMTSI